MKLFKKAKKGFTLVELVVVIAVIAILAAVSVGAYFGVTESAKNSQALQEGKALHTNLLLMANDPANDYVSFNGSDIEFGIESGTTKFTEEKVVAEIAKAAGKTGEVYSAIDNDNTGKKFPVIDLIENGTNIGKYNVMVYALDNTHRVAFDIATGAQKENYPFTDYFKAQES